MLANGIQGGWEKFSWIESGGALLLRAHSNKYVLVWADANPDKTLRADSTNASGAWERFSGGRASG
ncbi:hypothetical protein [Nonomuraea zeae]|uniref:hypothetical protein n=1 Tax=Nonomuraea zeae TaxID=1642303 RepID=UPI00110B255A|nr:hypothetical protein [Nonomuraea zeae]